MLSERAALSNSIINKKNKKFYRDFYAEFLHSLGQDIKENLAVLNWWTVRENWAIFCNSNHLINHWKESGYSSFKSCRRFNEIILITRLKNLVTLCKNYATPWVSDSSEQNLIYVAMNNVKQPEQHRTKKTFLHGERQIASDSMWNI